MKENIKRILINSIIIFIICFLFLFIFQAYQNYEYYSVYSKEDFSVKEVLLWDLGQSLYWVIRQMIIFVPILAILEKIKIRNIFKIIISLVITFIISFIYIMSNMTITF